MDKEYELQSLPGRCALVLNHTDKDVGCQTRVRCCNYGDGAVTKAAEANSIEVGAIIGTALGQSAAKHAPEMQAGRKYENSLLQPAWRN